MFCDETPSPYGRRGQTGTNAPGRQKAAKGSNELTAICRNDRLKFAVICRLQTKSFHTGHAIYQSRWLAMEGARGQSIESLCEDVVFIARKLGYAHVCLRLEDGEKVWQLAGMNKEDCYCSQYKLPGHRYCFLELGVPHSLAGEPQATASHPTNEATLKITGDLLAEGWAKAIVAWKRRHQLPLRFDAGRSTRGTAAPKSSG